MPNWCENIMTINNIFDEAKAKEIQEALRGPDSPPYYVPPAHQTTGNYDSNNQLIPGESDLSFQKLIPVPKHILMSAHPNYKHDNVANQLPTYEWGTKWSPIDVDVVEVGNELIYYFSTAWGPPLPIVKKISELFPEVEVEIKYMELGNLFAGKTTYVNGLETEREEVLDDIDELETFAIEEMGYDEQFFEDMGYRD